MHSGKGGREMEGRDLCFHLCLDERGVGRGVEHRPEKREPGDVVASIDCRGLVVVVGGGVEHQDTHAHHGRRTAEQLETSSGP